MAAAVDTNDCTVIKQAEIAGNYFSKHINFVLQVSSGEELRRRYTDFIWVRNWLTNDLPGAYVPAIPPKLPIALWPQGYLAKRKRELQWFLKRCAGIPYITGNKAYQLFLEPNSEVFQKTAKKFDGTRKKGVRKEQYEFITEKFPELAEEEPPEDHEKLDQEHLQHTQKLIERYDAMLKNSEGLSDSLSQSETSLKKFLASRHELIDMQSNEVTNSEFLARFLKRKRPDVDQYFEKEGDNHTVWSKCISRIWEPVLKKNFHDLKCIEEAMQMRNTINDEFKKATTTAEKWKTEDAGNKFHIDNLKAKQVDQRLNELENEETLEKLYKFLVKVVDSHRKMIEKMNMERWQAGVLTLKKHILPKWREQKTLWVESLRTFREEISKMEKLDAEVREQKEQERAEASKSLQMKEDALSTKEADDILESPKVDEDEDDLAYPIPEPSKPAEEEKVETEEEKLEDKLVTEEAEKEEKEKPEAEKIEKPAEEEKLEDKLVTEEAEKIEEKEKLEAEKIEEKEKPEAEKIEKPAEAEKTVEKVEAEKVENKEEIKAKVPDVVDPFAKEEENDEDLFANVDLKD